MLLAAKRKYWTQNEILYLKENYGKIKIEELSSFLKRKPSQVREKACLLNLKVKDKGLLYRKHNLNDNFFETPNLLNSYWAGFIAADGNISKNFRLVQISISKKDRIILEKFKNDICFDGKIENTNIKSKNQKASQIRFSSHKIVEDLNFNFNIVPNKTFVLEPPNLINFNNILAYIIGYIDGDGTISEYKKDNCKYIHFLGTENLLNWIKETLNEVSEPYKNKNSKVHKHTNANIFRYQINGRRAVEIYNTLKKIDVPKLQRKWK